MLKKIVFMGTSVFAVKILKSLYQNGYPIVTVYTQAPKKSNRGMKVTKSPVHSISETLSLEVRTPVTLKNNQEEYEYLKNIDADMCLVIAYGQIIPESFLNLTKKGFINIHASLLPKYRGAAPIQRAIMNLEKKTGISIMKINSQLDEGPVCKSYEIDIDEKDSSDDLSEKLSDLAVEKILDDIDDILDDKAKFRDQDHSNATYAKKIDKKESSIDWNTPAKSVIAKINGLNGAHFIFQGARYKILKAELNNLSGKPGEIIGDSLEIACKEKSIKVMMIQREGKKPQKTPEFLLGSQIKKGLFLSNV
ncbi:methionyl-tRNA formyltransferase [Candidatus Pelagibacter communis]|uniref:methionyl-tRNA formyltransferase n=1 Tax=Pelagibacter ubique TaxID=198252 RepID=UPI00094D0B6D|nr:methionyl-tRNA formyltransferase [Candidatus Pelagibacter ubique]